MAQVSVFGNERVIDENAKLNRRQLLPPQLMIEARDNGWQNELKCETMVNRQDRIHKTDNA